MKFLSNAIVCLYVFMFYPLKVNMFINKNVRRTTVFYALLLNAILTALLISLSNEITLKYMIDLNIIVIGMITVIFIIFGMILFFRIPKKLQEYDTEIETDNERIEQIIKMEKNWEKVYNIMLTGFVFSLIVYIFFTFIHKTNKIDTALIIWVAALLGGNCISWWLSKNSLKKFIKR